MVKPHLDTFSKCLSEGLVQLFVQWMGTGCVRTGIRTPPVGIYFSKAIRHNQTGTPEQVIIQQRRKPWCSLEGVAESSAREKMGTTEQERWSHLCLTALQRHVYKSRNMQTVLKQNSLPNWMVISRWVPSGQQIPLTCNPQRKFLHSHRSSFRR